MKVYDVIVNSQGKKVCVIDGVEREVLKSDGKKITLQWDDGKVKKFNVYGDTERTLKVQVSEEQDELLVSNGEKGAVFSRTAPWSKAVDKDGVVAYQVVATPSLGIADRLSKRYVKLQDEVYSVEENSTGEAVITKGTLSSEKVSEYIINETGSDIVEKVDSDTRTAGPFGKAARTRITPPPVGKGRPVAVPVESVKEKKSNPEEKKHNKRLLVLPLIIPLLIPVFLRSCEKNKPDPLPPDIKPSDVEPGRIDPDQEDPDIGVIPDDEFPSEDVILYLLDQVENLNPDLTQIKSSNFNEYESIYYDLSSFIPGDLDDKLQSHLGDDFVGLRDNDGTPSSFHKKIKGINDLTKDEKNLANNVNEILSIFKMSSTELNYELKTNGLTINSKYPTQNPNLAAMATIIESKTGLNIFEKDDIEEIFDIFHEYFKLQEEAREDLIDVKKIHKETTEESIPGRPNQEARDEYEEEVELHEISLKEEQNKLKGDREAVKLFEDLKTHAKAIVVVKKQIQQQALQQQTQQNTKVSQVAKYNRNPNGTINISLEEEGVDR